MRVRLQKPSSLAISSGIYTFSNVINSAIPFLLMPILTRYLSPTDYGTVAMFTVLISLVTPVIGINTIGAIERVYFNKEHIDLPTYIANCIFILCVSTAVVSLLFWVFSGLISKMVLLPERFLWTVIIVAFTQFLIRIPMTLWQFQNKPIVFGVFQIGLTLVNFLVCILFVVGFGMQWKGRIYAQIVAQVLFALFGVIVLIRGKWIRLSYNHKYVLSALKFGIPLIPHALGGVLMSITDRLFITNLVGIESTGMYTVGFQIGLIINILAVSFNQAYVPWLFMKLKQDNHAIKLKIVKLTYIYFAVMIGLVVLMSVSLPVFLKIFVGKEFAGSGVYAIWIAIGYAFQGMYYMVTNYIFYVGKTSILAMVTFFSAILNIGLNYFFIKWFGAIGASQATAIIFFIGFISTWILSSRVYKMPWNLKE